MYHTFTICYAGHPVRYAFRFKDTEKYFRPYIHPENGPEWDILAGTDYIERHRQYYIESTDDAYIEYKSLIGKTSLFLLPHNCCLFHAVAIKWMGKAWLLSGPPGTGKTTQYKNWRSLFPSGMEMICGDMPLLEFRTGNNIYVHPSPWNGKEKIRGNTSAVLGGIVCLEQGEANGMCMIAASECVVPLLTQFAVLPETGEQTLRVTSMEEQLLQHVPIWKFVNRGDRDSTRLMRDTLGRYMNGEPNEV